MKYPLWEHYLGLAEHNSLKVNGIRGRRLRVHSAQLMGSGSSQLERDQGEPGQDGVDRCPVVFEHHGIGTQLHLIRL